MRFPPNLKYLLLIFLILGAIVAGVIYLPKLIPNIGKILMWVMIWGMGILVLFVFIKPFLGFLYARADGLFAIYIDESNRGFHVFAYHIGSGGETGPSTRDIQHYFILLANGRVFYKCVYSHDMEPVAGRSGWSGFDSFETSVLKSKALEKTMQKLSAKAGFPLKLGQPIKVSDDYSAHFELEGYAIKLKKYESAVDEGIKVICTEKASNKLAWKQKI